jgi:predicted transcriptional regulator
MLTASRVSFYCVFRNSKKVQGFWIFMPLIDRHEKILKAIELLRTVSVQDLKERLEVSEVTIRKDLSFLEDMGLIIRTHGGARMAQDGNRMRNLRIRERENPELKRSIADKAAELIQEGDTVYLDSGSTCQTLAEVIRDSNRSIRIITNALPIMNILAVCESISLYTIGDLFAEKPPRSSVRFLWQISETIKSKPASWVPPVSTHGEYSPARTSSKAN